MINDIKNLFIIAVLFLSLDSVYLSTITPKFKNMIINVTGKPNVFEIIPAILTYLLLVFGLYYIIIKNNKGQFDAFIYGLVIYGVYEFTNKATIPNWEWQFAFIDTLWGGIVHLLVTYFYNKL